MSPEEKSKKTEKSKEEKAISLFWADQLASESVSRKKFRFTDDKVPEFKKFVVKSAASISGVLHIGRLSDTIRCDMVYKAIKDMGYTAELIWTADNVDPLRKIPEGIPKSYVEYIGVPVTDIPDPDGCHESYEAHHKSFYLEVVNKFIHDKVTVYSMREEYLKGSFKEEIKKILDDYSLVFEIHSKNRPKGRPLKKEWNPWQPICKNCGKIITTVATSIENGKVGYICKDYQFKTQSAKGCGYEGVDDPAKGNGKLLYKSELAAQWAHWKVVSEGFGKEYQVPGSAFWINAEIVEKVLKFPMPVPIFYEHIIIAGVKMSASLGNVIYPSNWLKAGTPELLRFFYGKKLMKTRDFSWADLPILYDDYDKHAKVFYGQQQLENKKEEAHMKRLYEISQLKTPEKIIPVDFSHLTFLTQFFDSDEKIIESLKQTGHYSKEYHEGIEKRIELARNWINLYAPPEAKIVLKTEVSEDVRKQISENQKKALKELGDNLSKNLKEEELHNLFWQISEKNGIKPQEFFKAVYLALLEKERGPKLAPFILTVGKEKVAGILGKV